MVDKPTRGERFLDQLGTGARKDAIFLARMQVFIMDGIAKQDIGVGDQLRTAVDAGDVGYAFGRLDDGTEYVAAIVDGRELAVVPIELIDPDGELFGPRAGGLS